MKKIFLIIMVLFLTVACSKKFSENSIKNAQTLNYKEVVSDFFKYKDTAPNGLIYLRNGEQVSSVTYFEELIPLYNVWFYSKQDKRRITKNLSYTYNNGKNFSVVYIGKEANIKKRIRFESGDKKKPMCFKVTEYLGKFNEISDFDFNFNFNECYLLVERTFFQSKENANLFIEGKSEYLATDLMYEYRLIAVYDTNGNRKLINFYENKGTGLIQPTLD